MTRPLTISRFLSLKVKDPSVLISRAGWVGFLPAKDLTSIFLSWWQREGEDFKLHLLDFIQLNDCNYNFA